MDAGAAVTVRAAGWLDAKGRHEKGRRAKAGAWAHRCFPLLTASGVMQEGSQPFLTPDFKATHSIASCVATHGLLGNIIQALKSMKETGSGCHKLGRGGCH